MWVKCFSDAKDITSGIAPLHLQWFAWEKSPNWITALCFAELDLTVGKEGNGGNSAVQYLKNKTSTITLQLNIRMMADSCQVQLTFIKGKMKLESREFIQSSPPQLPIFAAAEYKLGLHKILRSNTRHIPVWALGKQDRETNHVIQDNHIEEIPWTEGSWTPHSIYLHALPFQMEM